MTNMDFTAFELEKSLINVCFTTKIELNKSYGRFVSKT